MGNDKKKVKILTPKMVQKSFPKVSRWCGSDRIDDPRMTDFIPK